MGLLISFTVTVTIIVAIVYILKIELDKLG